MRTLQSKDAGTSPLAPARSAAEAAARNTLHGLGPDALLQMLLDAFRTYDEDKSGRLEKHEIEKCLQSLTLGATKLTCAAPPSRVPPS